MSPPSPPRAATPAAGLLEAAWAMPRWLGFGADALLSRMTRAFVGSAGTEPPAAAGQATLQQLTREEQSALDRAELYLERGLELKRWWDRTSAGGGFAQRFPLSTSYNRPDESFGFFDVAMVGGREMPIMGNFQTLLYDRPKSLAGDQAAAARWMRDQVRQFVLRYFMRVSYFRQPEAYVPATDRPPTPLLLRPFSLCPEDNPAFIGFGFSQLFFKRSDTGEIGAFPAADRYAMVDLREIGPKYRWTLLNVDIFDFNFAYQPLGPGTPSLTIPLTEGSHLIMDRAFVVDEHEPSPEVLGRYGFGYAFIKNPTPSLIAYGPGEFEAAIETITFTVFRDGTVRAAAVFVANRPIQIAHLPFGFGFDPVAAAIALANLFSGGLTARNLCLTKEQLETIFLVKHFMQHYQTLQGSVQTWRQIPDWLDADALPGWVVSGRAGG